jgi:Flp pilus assembly protein TadG
MAAFWTRQRDQGRRWDEGAAAIEAAFVLPVLILVLLGIIEFGMAVWQWNKMLLAVEQAGRYVMVNNTTCDTTCAKNQVLSVLSEDSDCTPICVSAVPSTTGSQAAMTLTATYKFSLLTLFKPFTITSATTVPLD